MNPTGLSGKPAAVFSLSPYPQQNWPWRKPSTVQSPGPRERQLSASSHSSAGRRASSPSPRPSTAASTSSVSPSSANSPARRPKHIPIVIPRYVPIAAPDSPSKTPTSAEPSISDFPLPGRKPSADPAKAKPRHVAIVIPTWAQPVQTFPDSPIATPSDCLAPSSPQSIGTISPIKMSSRPTPNTSRTNTMDSNASVPSPSQLYSESFRSNSSAYMSQSVNSSTTSLSRMATQESEASNPISRTNTGLSLSSQAGTSMHGPGMAASSQSTAGLSGLVCNVHRTTGREPHPLVGATTTILGDKLYVFGGRRLSRTRPTLTADLYELDLVRRHWTKLDTKGDIPPPRYFHSVCALGDTKLVCYGGMSPAVSPSGQPVGPPQGGSAQDSQPEVVVMSDIHIYDVNTRKWMKVDAAESPQGRYAHCAAILPSSAVFSSSAATLSAIQHNPASGNPNQGSLGVSLDGPGGAEMVVVGGQDSTNHYIEQISVFNLRSLKWTATNPLGRSCGAYRSVVAPLSTMPASHIGIGKDNVPPEEKSLDETRSSMLIYSNYNFLDVKLELQVRLPDGTLSEKPMHGSFSPPGLRFPNGGVIANHFVVSGTFLTSSKQEYALWALDLRTLAWNRIDAGGSIFSQGSWNRGVLWNRRNTFVILGNRKRSLVEDYNHRRINFSNVCMVELEAFGLYDNPRRTAPTSGYISVSSAMQQNQLAPAAGGRVLSSAAEELGLMALGVRELADMDFLAIGGERIPVNSHFVARRWGPYFNQLLREGTNSYEGSSDSATLRPTGTGHPSRNSSITITPSIRTAYTSSSTLTANTITPSNAGSSGSSSHSGPFDPPEASSPNPAARPRTLYLPHTLLTIRALVHYLYTSSLPSPPSSLCTPQILCSLLQLARPYRIDGLLEAVIESLHSLLDGRNTAAIFNAAAMAAGGGEGITFFNGTAAGLPHSKGAEKHTHNASVLSTSSSSTSASTDTGFDGFKNLRIDTSLPDGSRAGDNDEPNSASTETSASEIGSVKGVGEEREVWSGEMSAVVGLQKRGLRGLMEGRRLRMGRDDGGGGGEGRVGLGIA